MVGRLLTRSCTVAFLFVAALWPAIGLRAELRPTVGFAVSDSKFDVAGSEVTGHVTVFTGESITSGHLPTRLNLQDGWRFLIGVGSRVQVSEEALQLDGGSLEILASGPATRTLHVAGLRVVPQSSESKAGLYISRPDVATISVETGRVAVLRPNGKEIRTLEAGTVATFADTRDDMQVSEVHPAVEIGTIQAEQLKHLGQLGKLNSGIGKKANALLGTLAAASGGLIGGSGAGLGLIPPGAAGTPLGSAPEVSPAPAEPLSLMTSEGMRITITVTGPGGTVQRTFTPATQQVGGQVRRTVWRATGCGANCQFGIPIVTTHIFFFPVVGGIIRPFCIFPSCNAPPPFRP